MKTRYIARVGPQRAEFESLENAIKWAVLVSEASKEVAEIDTITEKTFAISHGNSNPTAPEV